MYEGRKRFPGLKKFSKDAKVMAFDAMAKCPALRPGQALFNIIDENFDQVARQVQFEDGIDCFYNNSMIGEFLKRCHKILKSRQEVKQA